MTEISSLPNAHIITGKQKGKRSELLTSSPFKKTLLVKKTSSGKKATPSCQKKLKLCKVKKYPCIVCGELYEDPPKEDWIQCDHCKKWCHENCF